uniref:F-box domain-containing protein n=1 Tax=Heterorhabditis bacteriophora TaxID=37862 RepID=A0A1I7W948_HETBA
MSPSHRLINTFQTRMNASEIRRMKLISKDMKYLIERGARHLTKQRIFRITFTEVSGALSGKPLKSLFCSIFRLRLVRTVLREGVSTTLKSSASRIFLGFAHIAIFSQLGCGMYVFFIIFSKINITLDFCDQLQRLFRENRIICESVDFAPSNYNDVKKLTIVDRLLSATEATSFLLVDYEHSIYSGFPLSTIFSLQLHIVNPIVKLNICISRNRTISMIDRPKRRCCERHTKNANTTRIKTAIRIFSTIPYHAARITLYYYILLNCYIIVLALIFIVTCYYRYFIRNKVSCTADTFYFLLLFNPILFCLIEPNICYSLYVIQSEGGVSRPLSRQSVRIKASKQHVVGLRKVLRKGIPLFAPKWDKVVHRPLKIQRPAQSRKILNILSHSCVTGTLKCIMI